MIVLAGYGFVGKAFYEVFKDTVKIGIIDPAYNNNTLDDFIDVEGVVCCVSTPQGADGRCDMTNVFDLFATIPKNIPVLIKSTISIEGWQQLKTNFSHHWISFSPEFLRAATAVEDLKNSNYFILSGDLTNFWQREVYKKRFPNAQIAYYSVEEAILIKYFRNSFLATKVSFFNEIFDLCDKLGITFDNVRKGVAEDTRIGGSHTYVNRTERGWSGACFPKDTAAILKIAQDYNINLNTLTAAVEYNKKIRKNLDNQ